MIHTCTDLIRPTSHQAILTGAQTVRQSNINRMSDQVKLDKQYSILDVVL